MIDEKENAVYIVRDGKKTKLQPKAYGQDIIYWKDGKVLDIERKVRTRLTGQDVIE